MPSTFLTLDLPATPILEVLLNGTVLGKAAWRSAARAESLAWPATIASRAGRVEEGALWVDADATSPDALRGATAIAVHDVVPGTPRWLGWYEGEGARPVVHPLRFTPTQPARLLDLEIRGTPDAIELWVRKPTPQPVRPELTERFRIAVLRPGAAVRVRRNEKRDFSLTGRRARAYTELDCLVRHLGTVDRVVLATPERATAVKPVRLDEAKVVDLRFELH